MKLFEVTSGGKFPLYPSDDYINGIVYAEKTPVKPFLSKFRAKSKNFENLRVLKKPIFSKSRVTKRPSEIKIR